ncbi:leader peptidase (prepilin peptidase)/N-methyltransferase [Thermosulfidibacter takaii ABI70S6]|uniref:Prepilin leader peptidase/N-methyltransferase n=1 Tax=Thermosulfidibacter takaii (strain DSM 17441 / JCM 13301 / NBRC 103674 / ABI70S6) TaxID=1298851 RepID=A0A0S3QS28_THET7|nr:A24 family peptidase [Thermosulfidibacter takaii]BAT71125.1 leader peptidase (prepilin peptidase)/N-methyltransferase [Thermosulfidibacter takaii ABI70S6]
MTYYNWLTLTLSIILGLILGSFFNVVIHRLPQGKSIVYPRSYCPKCKNPIKWYHNIPVVSYIFLKGKCAYCGEPISLRYPLVEILTACATSLLYVHYGLSWKLLWAYLFLLPLIPAAFIDINHYILPDSITIGTALWGLAASFLGFSPVDIKSSLIGLLACGGLFFIIAVASRGGMGLGDVKLAASIGANFGWKIGITCLFLSVFLGAFYGITMMLLKKKRRKDRIPFGPFMIISIYICAFWGKELAKWYLGF